VGLAIALTAGAAALAATPVGPALAISGIHGYQRGVAPLVRRAGFRCRFTPSCSRYAETVIARDGLVRGGWEAVRRIARCGPWTPLGSVDEP
jgi:uncharacterized protein